MLVERTHTCGELRKEHVGTEVTVQGWASAVRDRGGITFLVLRDRHGTVQIVTDERSSQAARDTAHDVRLEYVVQVTGTVAERDERSKNADMDTGDIEVVGQSIEILSGTRPLPFQINDKAEETTHEETRLKYRYLDLRRPKLQRNMRIRHQATIAARKYFDDNGFYEIETPYLTKATPEGARDYLVPSRVHPGQWYALPQSPQIFKQILMVSGMDRYVQIVRCFRDEDLRADRQPEFTQIDLEISFATQDLVTRLSEGCIRAMWKAVHGIDIGAVPKITFAQAIERFGIDAPDMRYGMELATLTDEVAGSDFVPLARALESGGVVRGLCVKGAAADSSRKVLDGWTDFVKRYGMGGLLWGKINPDGAVAGPLKKVDGNHLAAAFGKLGAEVGDVVLIGAGDAGKVNTGLGRLRIQIAKERELFTDDQLAFCWVVDFPMFEKADDGAWTPMHHPFTSPKPEHIDWLGTDKMGDMLSNAYDLCLNGVELGGGSIRIHREEVQQRVFAALGIGPDEQQEKFGFLLDALAHGAPPHGGLAFGLDRIIMHLCEAESLRDVIAFPKTTSAQDLMAGAPGNVDAHELDELNVKSTAPQG